jgi:SAM-dependent methyltransferase
MTDPSPWVVRFAPLIRTSGTALDLACGGGRHSRYLLGLGHKVVAVDRTTKALEDLASNPNCQVINAVLQVVAYEHGIVKNGPLPEVIQRLCAIKSGGVRRGDGDQPEPQRVYPDNTD